MQHILSAYKKILRENEKLKNQEETARKVNELLVERYSTSIPVQKVKNKIEEIDKEKLGFSENEWYLESEIKGYAIDKLQELLESEE